MPTLDVAKVAENLNEATVRDKIVKHYGLVDAPADPVQFVDAVVCRLNQPIARDAAHQALSPSRVFEAAVKAIGSNSRKWSSFLSIEPQLATLLGGYDPTSASNVSTTKIEGVLVGGYTGAGRPRNREVGAIAGGSRRVFEPADRRSRRSRRAEH